MKDEQPVPPPSPRSQSEISRSSAGHEWNDGITRRSFLKRSGGATLGTMVVWHMLPGRAEALGDENAGDSGDGFWEMKCTSPQPLTASGMAIQQIPFVAVYDLIVGTNQNPDNGWYTTKTVNHNFTLNCTMGGHVIGNASGQFVFDIGCNTKTGNVYSSLNLAKSTPSKSPAIVTKTFVVGLYTVTLRVYAIHTASGAQVKTWIYGTVHWYETSDSNHKGNFRIPQNSGTGIEIENTFASEQH